MFHKNTTINDNYQYYHIVIGDILLHSEIKLTPIQVQLLTIKSPQTIEKPNIPHLLPSSFGIKNDQTRASCDLKNPTITKFTPERTLSTKNLMRIHKVGWEFMKELKSKIITINSVQSKISTNNTDSNFT